MRTCNTNRNKKICIRFTGIPWAIVKHDIYRETQIRVGARPLPHIFANSTVFPDPIFTNRFDVQFVFQSSEEKKLMRIVEKYNGKLAPIRRDVGQWGIEETVHSGHVEGVELANEWILPDAKTPIINHKRI